MNEVRMHWTKHILDRCLHAVGKVVPTLADGFESSPMGICVHLRGQQVQAESQGLQQMADTANKP